MRPFLKRETDLKKIKTFTFLENTRAPNFSSNMTKNKTFLTCPEIFVNSSTLKAFHHY